MSNRTITGIVLQCNEQEVIVQVLHAPEDTDREMLLQKPFLTLVDENSIDAAMHFIESVRQMGHAENWDISLWLNEEKYDFIFSGARMDGNLMLMGHDASLSTAQPEDRYRRRAEETAEGEEGQPMTNPDDYAAMLEELSRLNNELINTKRELIRQNVKLRKLQNPWGDRGVTYI